MSTWDWVSFGMGVLAYALLDKLRREGRKTRLEWEGLMRRMRTRRIGHN